MYPESSQESYCSELSPAWDWPAWFPGLESLVKSGAWWIQGWGWRFLALDSPCLASGQRFLELEGSRPELSWWIRACWFRVRLLPVWWSDPARPSGPKFVRRLIRRSIPPWMTVRRRRFRLPHPFLSAARPSSRHPGEAGEKSVPAA